MALEIKWTLQAANGLENVIAYLELHWTAKEIINLELNIKQVLAQIVVFPELYPKSKSKLKLHKALIDKNNYLVYQVNHATAYIEIVNFRGSMQKPKH